VTKTPLRSSAEICAALRRAGFECVAKSGKGRHERWKKVTEQRSYTVSIVLGKKEVPRGTLESIVRQAGMTMEEFVAFLK